MNALMEGVLADLATESERLESLVVALPDAGWRTPTPAPGWDIATQIAHLAWTDEAAVAAATDKARWDALLTDLLTDVNGVVDRAALSGGAVAPTDLLARWRTARGDLVARPLFHRCLCSARGEVDPDQVPRHVPAFLLGSALVAPSQKKNGADARFSTLNRSSTPSARCCTGQESRSATMSSGPSLSRKAGRRRAPEHRKEPRECPRRMPRAHPVASAPRNVPR